MADISQNFEATANKRQRLENGSWHGVQNLPADTTHHELENSRIIGRKSPLIGGKGDDGLCTEEGTATCYGITKPAKQNGYIQTGPGGDHETVNEDGVSKKIASETDLISSQDEEPMNEIQTSQDIVSGNDKMDPTNETSNEFPLAEFILEEKENENEDDNMSDISSLSGLSSDGWRPVSGPMAWLQRQMEAGIDPRTIFNQLIPNGGDIPDSIDNLTLWKAIIDIISEPPRRKKLANFNTLDDVVKLLKTCKNVMVLTGAGVSVSCGIPDFRSRDGIYARLAVEYPDLPDPQAMFDIQYFTKNQKPFFKFAKEIYPGQFNPSTSHKFIRMIEKHGKLLRNYTQNIDTLEQVAGIENVIQCHGSFATATCMQCQHKTGAEDIKEDIMDQVIPRCPHCPQTEPLAIMKPDIVFFGESLPTKFHQQMEVDKDICDCLIVIGSSLKVRPVALIPNSLPANVPQILINRETLKHLKFDIELLGDCDDIVEELCHRLGEEWTSICTTEGPLNQMTRDEMSTPPLNSPQHSLSQDPSPDCANMRSDNSSPSSVQMMSIDNSRTSFENSDSSCPVKPPQKGSQNDTDNSTTANTTDFSGLVPSQTDNTPLSSSHDDDDDDNCREKTKKDSDTSIIKQNQGDNSEKTEQTTELDNNNKNLQHLKENNTMISESSNMPLDGAESRETVEESSNLDTSSSDLEELKACWEPKVINLSTRLKENTFLFLEPNRYVFKGAEFYDEEEDDESVADSCQDQGSSSDVSVSGSQSGKELLESNDDTQESYLSTIQDASNKDIDVNAVQSTPKQDPCQPSTDVKGLSECGSEVV